MLKSIFGMRTTVNNSGKKLVKIKHEPNSTHPKLRKNNIELAEITTASLAGKYNTLEIESVKNPDSHSTVMATQLSENTKKNKVSLEEFIVKSSVGEGKFAAIKIIKGDTGGVYVFKAFDEDFAKHQRNRQPKIMKERKLLEDMTHPFIVSLRFSFQASSKQFLVFDFFNGKELFKDIYKGKPFDEKQTKVYAAEIVLALEYIHHSYIVLVIS